MLQSSRRLRGSLGLSAGEWPVFLAIITAAIQRYARAPDGDPGFRDATPLPADLVCPISRRRIADAVHLPQETVRRTVRRLSSRGLVREGERGVHGTVGVLGRLDDAGLVEDAVRSLLGDAIADGRHVVDGYPAKVRLVAYHTGNAGLGMLASLRRQYRLPPDVQETLLFLLTRAGEAPLSQRALATQTGFPRETARRHLAQLAERGVLAGSTTLAPGARAGHLAHPEAAERLRLVRQLRQELQAISSGEGRKGDGV